MMPLNDAASAEVDGFIMMVHAGQGTDGRRMPYTMTAFLIGALSVIGLPPTGGVISKWYLIMGALEAEYVFVMVILLASSFLNKLASCLNILACFSFNNGAPAFLPLTGKSLPFVTVYAQNNTRKVIIKRSCMFVLSIINNLIKLFASGYVYMVC